ncbi:glycosyl hydrolase 115 family protein [Rathayibacter sp. VKM Ac-2835]|uniref:glycosyl hydrolase 115 family protein n=1 Tax=Rathayibacter sp. VKM Ac-2835 TaxID=2739043 RepID=UPI001564D4CC|nr:glycosyl hydrolase 115 family protein [Rathayibacter sp. VKM Ac-2835]NRG43064.1 glycosyl hydrolase 115 family protein [Rathayibacter sp. VKM Ac-2835]
MLIDAGTTGPTTVRPPAEPTRSIPLLTDLASDGITVAERGQIVRLAVEDTEDSAVRRATADLARDLAQVSGAHAVISTDTAAARIVIGTIGHSAAVDAAIDAGRLDVSALYDEDGAARWEGFLVAVVDDVLYLVGTDRRGTVYAIYHFTDAIGVSAWTWWGDVPVRPRDHITLRPDTSIADWPSVRYRGIFLNDEEELDHWARIHTSDDTIGPATYERVYELILRLKGNYLWPAMHVGAFNHDPENGRLAHEMGVVIGTSHCDMLLRSNEREFPSWVAEHGGDVDYDYSIEGRNRALLQQYWRGSVAQNRGYEVTWTVGMRGVHDSGFVTTAIDDDDSLSESEKLTARVHLLESVMRDQRALLTEGLSRPAETTPQLFIPYKEVLPLYDAGLQVPDDITIVWANDSFGHIRRLPDENEQRRRGGHGLYYHSSYWSNYTTSYLATSSTPLALMKSELRKAWDGGIRELWVDNIGGLKPLEIEMEFFLRSAWEAGRETSTANITAFTAEWIDAKFTGGHGARAGRIYDEYYQLNNQRKLEHLASGVFPQRGYGDEAGDRLAQLRRLFEDTNEIWTALPAEERDAFFQLFAVKIHLAYLTSAEFYFADRSTLSADDGAAAAADHYLAVSRAFGRSIRALIDFYNHRLAGGRWEGMFTPQEFPPPVMPMHPAATPALSFGEPGLAVTVWGADAPEPAPSLIFDPAGTATKWIEIANRGRDSLDVTIDADPWIEMGPHPSSVSTETRIPVRVQPTPDGAEGRIRITSATGIIDVRVSARPAATPPTELRGWIEAEGSISIDPSHPDGRPLTGSSRWAAVPGLGRYGNPAVKALPLDASDLSDDPLTFDIHLRTEGAHLLELHRLPTLNSVGRIRVGVSTDGHPPMTLESPTTDEHRGTWSQAIQDNVEKLHTRLPWLSAGAHRLRLHAIDDDVTLSKIVVYTEPARPSNLGPTFSSHSSRPRALETVEDPALASPSSIDAQTRRLYGADPATLPLPDQAYADSLFWEGPTTFRLPITVPQQAARRRERSDDSTGEGRIVESEGIIAFDAETVLEQSASAWSTADTSSTWTWSHTAAETGNGSGLAMHVRTRGLRWDDSTHAPGLHYALTVGTAGRYRAWLLVKFDNDQDDSCVLAVDGTPQPLEKQFSGAEMCAYGLRQRWIWVAVSDIDLLAGPHTFSVLARKSALRVDRIYLTLGDELPPTDASWRPSGRSFDATR